MTFLVVELSSQIIPACIRGELDGILYNPLSVLGRSGGFLSYLVLYGARHRQTVSQSIIVNCGSDHGDVLTGEAVV